MPMRVAVVASLSAFRRTESLVWCTSDRIDGIAICIVVATTLVTGGFGGRYAASGHLVYARPGALMAAPFDVSRGALTGEPVPVIEGLDVDASNAAPYFSIGGDGTLLYLAAGAAANRIMWAEAAARPLPITEEKRGFQYPAVSPDGRRIAVSVYEEGSADL